MKWISVKKRLPPDDKPVLVTYLGHCTRRHYCDLMAVFANGEWKYYDTTVFPCDLTITHWMPLPRLPREVRRIDREGYEIQMLRRKVPMLNRVIDRLQPRCSSLTDGDLCAACDFKQCKYRQTVGGVVKNASERHR